MKKKLICLFVMVMMLITALPVFAEDIYVKTTGEEGNDWLTGGVLILVLCCV